MRPKFALQINVEREEVQLAAPTAATAAEQQHNVMGSLRLNNDGITVMTNSYNPYSFSSEGMQKSDGQHYKISEKDIRVVKRLGAGASSTVFKGFLFSENKFVAVKKINVFDRDTRHQMLNDVKALCDAQTVPGLISFCGAYHVPDTGQISIVLEYMDGGSLADILAKVGRIPENILSKITAKILRGLQYLHRNKHMVHRDIKPANILMNLEGEPKITDFGISAFIDSTLAVCNTFLGTVTYMSPERINNEQYSFPADIWSLGLAIIECATGRYPYDASVGPLQLMMEVLNEEVPLPQGPEHSDAFRDFVRQCMHKSPLKRGTIDQLLLHPFIKQYESDKSSDLKAFMQCVFDPHDKLDEIAVVFAWNYYALLSAGPDRLRDLAPLYSDNSVYIHDGERARGRASIIAALRKEAQTYAGFKVVHQVKEVDCQPLGVDGSALVHVQGQLTVPAMSGPGSEPVTFTEAFILAQIQPGEYYVANQVHRVQLAAMRSH
ncbi:mitogen-activated protein kinase [Haematococcus lacustris]